MENPPPIRKKWSERQFELFIDATRELGQEASKDDFERLLDRILPPRDPKRKRRRRNGGGAGYDDQS